MRTKLLFVIDNLQFGGGERVFAQIINGIDKEKYDDLKSALQELGLKEKSYNVFMQFLETKEIKKIQEYLGVEAEDEIKKMIDIISLLKNSFKIDNPNIKMGIVRGLDYYDGIVFEIDAPTLGAEKQICGGGAYNLLKIFGGRETVLHSYLT